MPPPSGYTLDDQDTPQAHLADSPENVRVAENLSALPDLKKEAARRKPGKKAQAPAAGPKLDGGVVVPPAGYTLDDEDGGPTARFIKQLHSKPDPRTPGPDVLDKVKDFFTSLAQPDPYRTDTKAAADAGLTGNLIAAKNAAENAFVTMPGNLLRRAAGGVAGTAIDTLRGARNLIEAGLGDEYRQEQVTGAVSDIAQHPIEATTLPGLLRDYAHNEGPEPGLTLASKVGGDVTAATVGFEGLKKALAKRLFAGREAGGGPVAPKEPATGQAPARVAGEPTPIPAEDLGLGGGAAPAEKPVEEAPRSYASGGALQPQEATGPETQAEGGKATLTQELEPPGPGAPGSTDLLDALTDRWTRREETESALRRDLADMGLAPQDAQDLIRAMGETGVQAYGRGDISAALEAAHHQLLLERILDGSGEGSGETGQPPVQLRLEPEAGPVETSRPEEKPGKTPEYTPGYVAGIAAQIGVGKGRKKKPDQANQAALPFPEPGQEPVQAEPVPATPENIFTGEPAQVQPEPGKAKRQTVSSLIAGFMKRAAMDQAGQDILDQMIENQENPSEIEKKFWRDTYFKLPGNIQRRFQNMLKNLSGFQPGDTIGTDKDGNPIVAKTWMDIADHAVAGTHLGNEAEYLEGGDRGYAVLMREANRNLANAPSKATAVAAPPLAAPETPQFKFGNTQAAVPKESDAYTAFTGLQGKVEDGDLAGKGKDVDEPHVTVRYGIQGDDVAGITRYLEGLAPFEVKLGSTEIFPPSPSSDGAAVVMVPVDSPELHQINDQIQKHGDFTEPSFKEYKPHLTVAYVKPEAAQKYKGMADGAGKTFRIAAVDISDRNGNKSTVALKGQAAPVTRTYEQAQNDIAAAEAKLKEQGVDVEKLFLPEPATVAAALAKQPGWTPMPPDLAALYRERDGLAPGDDQPTRMDLEAGANAAQQAADLATQAAPVWYLKSERALEGKMKGPMAGRDVLRMLQNNGVSPDELKWTGLDDWLPDAGRVTPDEVRAHIAENAIRVEEVTKGQIDPEQLPITPAMRDSAIREGVPLFNLERTMEPARAAVAAGPGAQPRANIALRETLPGARDWTAKVYENKLNLERLEKELQAADQDMSAKMASINQLTGKAPISTIHRLRQELEDYNQRRRAAYVRLQQLDQEHDALRAADPHVGEIRLDAEGNPTLYLNARAMTVVQNLMRPGQEGMLKGAAWTVPEARWIKGRMKTAHPANATEEQIWQPLTRLLDTAIARSRQGGITLVGKTGQGIHSAIDTMREELLHRWQTSRTANGRTETHLSDQAFLRLYYEMPNTAHDYLRTQGYGHHDPKSEVLMFVIEGAAKIMAGKWRKMGLTPQQAKAWLKRYYDEVAGQHGADAIAEIKHTHGLARELQREWEGTYGATKGTDAGPVTAGAEGRRTGEGQPVDDRQRPEDDTQPGRLSLGLPEERGAAGSADDTHARAGGGRRPGPGVEPAPLEVEQAELPASKQRPIKTFVSPNVFNLNSVDEAQKRLGSMPHKLMRQESAWLLGELGSQVKPRTGTGIWSDGAEDTLIHEFPADADPDLVTYHNAVMAKAGGQKFLLNFFPHEDGNDVLFRVNLPKSAGGPGNIANILGQHGIDASTIVSEYDGHAAFIATTADGEDKTLDAINQIVRELGGEEDGRSGFRVHRGRTEYVGDNDRGRAKGVFEKVIEDREKLHPEWHSIRVRLESRPDFHELQRLTDESLRLLESGQIKDPFTRASHGSRAPGIVQVDPSFHGKGPQGGLESKRKKEWREYWVNRSYFQVEGIPGEPFYERLPYQYQATFNRENLYDYHRDPRRLFEQVPDEVARYGEGARTYFEKLIKDAGYDGYYVSHGPQAGAVAAFNNTPVEARLKAGEIKLPPPGANAEEPLPPQRLDLENVKRQAAARKPGGEMDRLRSALRHFNSQGTMGEARTAALVAGDGKVALSDYHFNIKGEVGYGDYANVHWEEPFLKDGGVRVRANHGEISIEFGQNDAATFQRVRNVIQALPQHHGEQFMLDFTAYDPEGKVSFAKSRNWMGWDREEALAKLDDWETRGMRPAPAYGSLAWFREQGDKPTRFDLERGSATDTPQFKAWFGDSTVVDKDRKPKIVYHGSHANIDAFRRTRGAHFGFHFGDQEAANTRLEDTADKRLDKEGMDRVRKDSEAKFDALSRYESELSGKSTPVPHEELLRALEAHENGDNKALGDVFDKHAYKPTAEETARLAELREKYERSRQPIMPFGVGSNIGAYYLRLGSPLRMPDVGNWKSVTAIQEHLPFDSDARSLSELEDDIKSHGYDGIVYNNRVENPVMKTESYIVFDPEQIKSATGNRGTFDPERKPTRFDLEAEPNLRWTDIRRYLLPEERKAYEGNPDLQRKMVSTVNMMPSQAEFDAAVKTGESGRLWYERSSRAFDSLLDTLPDTFEPGDKDKFLNFVAALSPVQTVRGNLVMALNLWDKWNKAGRPQDVEWNDPKKFSGGVASKNAKLYRILKGYGSTPGVEMETRMNNAIRALQGQPLSGPKVSSFAPNLGEETRKSTNDTWIAVFADQDPNRINRKHIYDVVTARMRIAAEKNGIPTRQASAAVWSFIKALAEVSGWGNDRWIPPQDIINQGLLTPELIDAHAADFADLLKNDPEIRAKIEKIGGDLDALDRRLEERVPRRPARSASEGEIKELAQRLLGAANRLETARANARIQAHLTMKSEEPGLFDDASFGFGEAVEKPPPDPLGALKAEAKARKP